MHWHKEWLRAQQAIEEEEMETEQLMTINNESISTNDATNTTSSGNDVYRQFSNIVIIPTNSDILFAGSGNGEQDCGVVGIRVGKGNIYNHRKHPGNLRWAILLEKYYEQYKAIPKQEFGKKTELSEIVVESVQKNDGRFLKRDLKVRLSIFCKLCARRFVCIYVLSLLCLFIEQAFCIFICSLIFTLTDCVN